MTEKKSAATATGSRAKKASGDYGASSIQVLEGLEAVRKRPGMYIGSTDERGLHHLVYEVVDNSVDEAMAGHATRIVVRINKDNSITVADDGRGVPVGKHATGKDALEVVHTVLHAGGKFGGGGYKVSGGLHGVGVSVVNALSTKLDVEVRQQGAIYTQSYANGVPLAPLKKGGATKDTGTSVTFWPNAEIFETVEFDFETLRQRFQQMAFLNKGLSLTVTDQRTGDKNQGGNTPVTYKFDRGLMDYVEYLNKAKKAEIVNEEIICFESEDKEKSLSVEIAMQWTTAYIESVHTYANTINTHEGGTHDEGFRAALTSLINKYARDKGILKEKDENLSGDDVREGLTAVISIKLPWSNSGGKPA